MDTLLGPDVGANVQIMLIIYVNLWYSDFI